MRIYLRFLFLCEKRGNNKSAKKRGMMKMLSLRNGLQKSETNTLVSIVEKQQDRHQFTQATSSMKQETTDLQAIHTTSKLCAIIATSIDDTKTQSKQVNDSMKNDLEDMMNFKRNTLNIGINEALTSIECLKEIKQLRKTTVMQEIEYNDLLKRFAKVEEELEDYRMQELFKK